MEAHELISKLHQDNYAFWPGTHISNPNGPMMEQTLIVTPTPTPQLAEEIRKHKTAILEYCQADYADLVIPAAYGVVAEALDTGCLDTPAIELEERLIEHAANPTEEALARIRTETLSLYQRIHPDKRFASLWGKSLNQIRANQRKAPTATPQEAAA